MKVLVTGAGGFIGRGLVRLLKDKDFTVVAGVRSVESAVTPCQSIAGGLRDLASGQLADADAVVHLAARAHVTRERERDPIATFRAVNVQPTLQLFEACQSSGVRRFVFVSSIGVNGVATTAEAFRREDVPKPTEPYAISKWEAERGLQERARHGSTELVIVRPALVYGPQAKGNFLRLLRLIRSGIPIPFGSVEARRSLLSLTRLCELLYLCIVREQAAGEVFLAADREPISTRELVVIIAGLMNSRARLISVPPRILTGLAKLAGLSVEMSRLTSSLVVDSAATRESLGWDSQSTPNSDMQDMVEAFQGGKNAIA